MPSAVDIPLIRRGALFFVAVGLPVVFAIIRGDPQAAQLGAVLGLTLAFADNDKDLPRRLRQMADKQAAPLLEQTATVVAQPLAEQLWPLLPTSLLPSYFIYLIVPPAARLSTPTQLFYDEMLRRLRAKADFN